MTKKATHLNKSGQAQMVNVGAKTPTAREATAETQISMSTTTAKTLQAGHPAKGNALTTAQIAAIQAAKQTDKLIPLCHPIPLEHTEINFAWKTHADKTTLTIQSTCRATAKTGVEMEALTAASIAALTIYDFCKSMERSVTIKNTRLVSKKGGKSGNYNAP
ncbi:MAG: cyclic pyranopterin monophosphate synthase MoaC [Alphaproteobacteria bacterium]|nr:cyclic pyranopterin monophosphate synthase MoaC [Alphaproteobacteria bacterium]